MTGVRAVAMGLRVIIGAGGYEIWGFGYKGYMLWGYGALGVGGIC